MRKGDNVTLNRATVERDYGNIKGTVFEDLLNGPCTIDLVRETSETFYAIKCESVDTIMWLTAEYLN